MSGFWTDSMVRQALGLSLRDAAAARPFVDIGTDTRTLRRGSLFVALQGERFDAHEFLADAVARGASGVVVRQGHPALDDPMPADVARYRVRDTLEALGLLARHYRRHLTGRVCAVTGTNGKTTTKELLAAALAASYRVHATAGNQNNLVGVPLTLLAAPQEAETVVVELGTNSPGEIALLAAVVEPEAAIITGVAEGHLEGLSDLEGVLEEKTSLLSAVRRGGLALVVEEPPELAARARRIMPRVEVAGLGAAADPDLRAEDLQLDEFGRATFAWAGQRVMLQLHGRQNVRNALLALGLARAWGVAPDVAAAGVARVRPLALRGEVLRYGELTVIADCYNSNPASLDAALDLLLCMPRRGGRVAVLGSMLELGHAASGLHRAAASRLARAGLDLVVATGEFVPAFSGLEKQLAGRLRLIADPEDAGPVLRERLSGNEVVLLKGSRGVALERLLPVLQHEIGRAAGAPGAEGG